MEEKQEVENTEETQKTHVVLCVEGEMVIYFLLLQHCRWYNIVRFVIFGCPSVPQQYSPNAV